MYAIEQARKPISNAPIHSFTAENRATTGLLPESSNVKCRKLPKKTIKTMPASSNLMIDTLRIIIRQSITKIEYKKISKTTAHRQDIEKHLSIEQTKWRIRELKYTRGSPSLVKEREISLLNAPGLGPGPVGVRGFKSHPPHKYLG